MKDIQIIENLRSDKQIKTLKRLYRYFPKVEKLILSKGGNKEDALDTFQEALLIFCRKTENPDFRLTVKAETYLYSICHLLWKNQLRRQKSKLTFDPEMTLPNSEQEDLETYLEKEEKLRKVDSVLRPVGKRCQELLRLFYYESLRMKVIASKMGFSSEKSAKTQKYKCLERARNKLSAHSS